MKLLDNVGIINFQYSNHNYGAVLQAAALAHFLNSKGVAVKHIDYNSEVKKQKKGFLYLIKLLLRKIGLVNFIKRILGKKVIIKHEVDNDQVFELFRQKWIARTKRINNLCDINGGAEFDAVIVGSDQVWRPTMYSNLLDYKAYFLGDINNNVRKISYAASFGIDKWEIHDVEINKEIKSYISRFSAISVREVSGKDICKKIFNVNACFVLDPTLLVGVDFFNKIIAEEVSEESAIAPVVYYKLDVDSVFLKNIDKLGSMKAKKIENIYYKSNNSGFEYFSVASWLSNIKNSELVITDSFHCICFAILFKKEFLCCVNESRGLSRLQNILGLLGLEDRICSSSEDFYEKLKNIKQINYHLVDQRLQEQRFHSERFLLNSLLANTMQEG